MHETLAQAWDHCQRARAALLATIEPVPAEAWSRSGPAGGWTLSQQVDHLLKSEIGTSKIARKLIRGDFRGLERPANVRLLDSSLAVYPFPPGKAPDQLVPAPAGGKDALLSELRAAHSRFQEELARFAGPDPDALSSPDISEFWFTLGGWVRVQALHEEHHLHQIQRLLQ
jgi:hypothetical protein